MMKQLNKEQLQRIKFDYNYMMSDFLGDDYGIKKSELDELKPAFSLAFEQFKSERGKGMVGWSELMYNQNEVVSDILQTAEKVRSQCEYFVVLGIGGSALGPIAVFQALKHLHHNELSKEKRNAPKFYVEDNVDPERMRALLDVIEVDKTIFNVITKSGATSETMSQYLIIWDILKAALGDKAKEHMIATTSKTSGNLIKLAKKEGLKTFYIPDGVGGRFSELCPVGLFPAAVLGIDIKEMLSGAAYMDKICSSADLKTNPAMAFAAVQYIAFKKGKNISVMMPYADSLRFMADWYCQLWAESLGKAVKKDGSPAYVGQTPVKSLGVTDQHSQVQLYTEGPFDKVVTFIKVENYRSEVKIPEGLSEFPDVNFLCGHTMNKLIDNECFATAFALMKKKRLNNTIILPLVNEFTLGQLMFMLELATAYTGALFGIDTYNQPGVETGKNYTYALFNRVGYDDYLKELNLKTEKKEEFIC